jgi:aryl-alcohol dehydrogenase-like predicted oxidoreductase
MGRTVLLAWLVTVGLAYAGLGGTFGLLIEGYDRSRLSVLPALLTVASGLVAFALTVRWQSRRGAGGETPVPSTRRRFLIGALSTGAGFAASVAAVVARNFGWFDTSARHIFLVNPPQIAPEYEKAWAGTTVREYRRLGRTDARVSDISLGSGSSTGGRQGVAVAREAIERGINYFDTAPDYAGEGSEKTLGEAMKGQRDRMFLATKFCNPQGHLGPGASVEDYIAAVNASLVRLQTDWVDLIHIHSCNTVERLLDENAHEAFDRLKEQGKARFLGVSTHTPDLERVATAALDSQRFDVMMLAYHHGAWPALGDIIDRAAREDVGVVAMKTLRGAKHEGLLWSRDERDSYTQAAFKWVLANPSVSCLVISIWDSQQIDEYLHASGTCLDAHDLAVLERYRELTAGTHCRQHCGVCLSRCPEGLPIDDVLRQRMYFEQGAEKEAMRLYASLERKADVCAGCAAPCAGACPDGIAIQDRVRGAHELLTLA